MSSENGRSNDINALNDINGYDDLIEKVTNLSLELKNANELVLSIFREDEDIQINQPDLVKNILDVKTEYNQIRSHLQDSMSREKDLQYKLKASQAEASRFQRHYNAVLASKRYRVGDMVAKVCKIPFVFLRLIKKLILTTYRKITKSIKSGTALTRDNLIACIQLISKRLKKKSFKYNGISVIIPTYREIDYLDECVKSVLQQTLEHKKIEILITVNGANKQYFADLKTKYSATKNIRVIHTSKQGLSAARNYALKFATMDYVTFLDDDDYLTKGYLEELASHLETGVEIVCGRLVDLIDGKINNDTYINKELEKIHKGGKTKDYNLIGSLLSPATAKLYKTKLVRDNFEQFHEDLSNTEDIVFWADNFGRIDGYIYCCDASLSEAYVRRVLNASMSRPSEGKLYQFGVIDRVNIISYLAGKIYDPTLSTEHKRFLLNKINAQTNTMQKCYVALSKEDQEKANKLIYSLNEHYLNKCLFASANGIAFCHNFSPSADASAYVATKRLPQISNLEGKGIKWKVISSDMSNCRSQDRFFNMFYASYVMGSHIVLSKPSYFNEQAQHLFGQKAFKCVKDEDVDFVYSRSMFAGSHDAAYLYKQKCPTVKWYAEFSDPVFMGTNDLPRPVTKIYQGEEAFLNNYWREVEQKVYDLADVIIFTNEKQREYMLEYNPCREKNAGIMAKSLIMWQPSLERKFCNIIPSAYAADKSRINVGYFGTFYPNRQYTDMLELLKNEKVDLHFFVPNPEELKGIQSSRIHVSQVVGHLEYLNTAAKMDYLYLNDITFEGKINPYLPSKLADYLSTGSMIIALVKKGSVLSDFSHPNILKVYAIDEAFALSLIKCNRSIL